MNEVVSIERIKELAQAEAARVAAHTVAGVNPFTRGTPAHLKWTVEFYAAQGITARPRGDQLETTPENS